MKVLPSFLAISAAGILAVSVTSKGQQISLPDQSKPTYHTTGSEGTINGVISFTGDVPEPQRINTRAKPVCAAKQLFTEDIVVTNGKLANVMVFLRSGDALETYVFDPPKAEISLAHLGCQIVPHVLGLQVQQTLNIGNSDSTYHNTYLGPDDSMANPVGYPPLARRFTQPEFAIPVTCNQHRWEKAYVSVFTHPFFAVSARDGSYQISGVPPGRYTIVAWHERFGEKTMEISVSAQEQKTVDFAFDSLPKQAS